MFVLCLETYYCCRRLNNSKLMREDMCQYRGSGYYRGKEKLIMLYTIQNRNFIVHMGDQCIEVVVV